MPSGWCSRDTLTTDRATSRMPASKSKSSGSQPDRLAEPHPAGHQQRREDLSRLGRQAAPHLQVLLRRGDLDCRSAPAPWGSSRHGTGCSPGSHSATAIRTSRRAPPWPADRVRRSPALLQRRDVVARHRPVCLGQSAPAKEREYVQPQRVRIRVLSVPLDLVVPKEQRRILLDRPCRADTRIQPASCTASESRRAAPPPRRPRAPAPCVLKVPADR